MPQPQYYTDPALKPRADFSDIILIIRLLIKKKSPIHMASPAVYERLGLETIARSNRYLGLGLIGFFIGLATISTVIAVQGRAAMLPISLIAALVPAAAYLGWMYMNDRLEPEHIWLVMLAFGWGALSVLPAIILNDLLQVGWLGRAAFTEEPLKMLGVYFIATNQWLKSEYNDHLDGLVYGAAAGIGFAFMENILYIARYLEAMPILIIPTRIMAMAMHMFVTSIIGYWIGYLKVHGIAVSVASVLPALAFSIFTHAVWNTIAQFLGDAGLIILYIWAGAMIYYLNKLAKEALIDEYYWGYAHGYAPRE
jgi:RsiW-degrading membrane proteinase PrsW (M82 family)